MALRRDIVDVNKLSSNSICLIIRGLVKSLCCLHFECINPHLFLLFVSFFFLSFFSLVCLRKQPEFMVVQASNDEVVYL